MKYLVEEIGLDVNTQDTPGYTAVMGAAYRGQNDVVEYLVSKGARVDLRTARGWSATDMANGPSLRSSVPLSHPETIALLARLGAPPLLKVEGEEILGSDQRQGPSAKARGRHRQIGGFERARCQRRKQSRSYETTQPNSYQFHSTFNHDARCIRSGRA